MLLKDHPRTLGHRKKGSKEKPFNSSYLQI